MSLCYNPDGGDIYIYIYIYIYLNKVNYRFKKAQMRKESWLHPISFVKIVS